MKYFHEVREDVIRIGEPILVEVGSSTEGYNFRSTFDYPEDVATQIRAAGNTAGLRGLPVSCSCIYIDVDDSKDIDEVRERLLESCIAFDEYKTGNRGAHFHVPLAYRVTGSSVIYSVTQWLKKIMIWHLIDTSIYREGGQFRLEHAVHSKTGRYKTLVQEIDQTLLELPIVEPEQVPIPSYIYNTEKGTPEAIRDFYINLVAKRGIGQRHTHLYICWCRGIEAGLTVEEIGDALREWNKRQVEPHTDAVIEQKIQAFNKRRLNVYSRNDGNK